MGEIDVRRTVKNTLLGAVLALLSALGWAVSFSMPSHAETVSAGVDRAEILTVYQAFKDAQNARDVDAIGSFFIDGPQFLWVSDGRSFWGRDAVLRRMSSFQRAEHWVVLPDLEAAEVIALGDDTAILHMPLVLQIGRSEAPNNIGFLVSIVFQDVEGAWKIAALLTTEDKQSS